MKDYWLTGIISNHLSKHKKEQNRKRRKRRKWTELKVKKHIEKEKCEKMK